MKRSAIALVTLMLLSLASVSMAEFHLPNVGIYGDSPNYLQCYEAGAISGFGDRTYTFYIVAMLATGPGDVTSILSADFQVNGIVDVGGVSDWETVTWADGATVTGGIHDADGVQIDFAVAQAGPSVLLGSITIFDAASNEINSNTPCGIHGYQGIDSQLVIYDEAGNPHVANGGAFTLRSSGTPVCDDAVTPAEVSTWSTIKCLY